MKGALRIDTYGYSVVGAFVRPVAVVEPARK